MRRCRTCPANESIRLLQHAWNAVGVHGAGVLGHLPPDERAAGLSAALGDAGHDLLHDVGVQGADGQLTVIEVRTWIPETSMSQLGRVGVSTLSPGRYMVAVT